MSRAHSHSPAAHAHPGHEEHHHPGLSVAVAQEAGKASVTMTLTAEELERARAREFAALAQRVTLKGFRPGKTPRALLEKHYAGDVERGVLEHFLQHAYQQAVEEHKLRPASTPRLPESALPKKGEGWSVTFTVFLRPEVRLGDIDGLEVQGQPVEVTELEVDKALAEIRRANSRAEVAGDEPLAPEGLCVATLDFYRPGASESCLRREGIRLTPKVAPQGVDPATFEETLAGARKGEERSLELEFPPNFPLEEARGEKGRVRLELTEVYRVVAPPDAELYKAFEASDEPSLRTAVQARMRKAKEENEEQRIENELLERLIADHPMELPEELVQEQVETHQAELQKKLEEQGISAEEARTRAEGERDRSRESAVKSLKAVYLIEEIARTKELKVEQSDVSAELSAIGERNGTPAAEVAKYYREQGLLRQLGLELLERKVRRYLRASAAVRPPA